MSRIFSFLLVLRVKDIFLVSPGPSQICEGKCILLSVLMHPVVGPREPSGGRAYCRPPPQLARCQDLMHFLCKLNRLLESHPCQGLCGAGKESQPFFHGICCDDWDFNILSSEQAGDLPQRPVQRVKSPD